MATQQIPKLLVKEIALAQSLPPRLLRFFAKYPPGSVATATPSAASIAISTTSPSEPDAPVTEATSPGDVASNSSLPPLQNPFLPHKNFRTGAWHSPRYGLRQQAGLVKLALDHGVVDLLPYTIKKPGEKEMRRIERGLRVKGTGEGEKVKGKGWERTLKGKLELRRKAMERMPQLIQEWKQKGHGRGWKKWPKAGGHGVL